MKIVKILGGLGNQMFQYALAVALQQRHHTDVVKYDIESFRGYPLHNGFELDKLFQLTIPRATKLEIVKLAYPYFDYRVWQILSRLLPSRTGMYVERKEMAFDDTLLGNSSPMWYDGYWQSEKYFKDYRPILLKEFTFSEFTEKENLRLLKIIQSSKCTSMHIRRGDYVAHPLFKDICTVDYYRTAINYIREQTEVDNILVFSNDIEWCQKKIGNSFLGVNSIYVNWNTGEHCFRDMQLMSLCHNNIIANSSFSWWGAWLNQNEDKIVLCPSRWMNKGYAPDIIPDEWIRI